MNAVIFRSRGDADKRPFEDALARLLAEHAPVLVLPHLYHIAEDADVWSELAAVDGPLLALSWLHPRPAEWLLKGHGVGGAGLTTLDMAAFDSAEACFDACREHLPDAGAPTPPTDRACETADRWYPVVDIARCVNCKQCLRFCLFGVYELGPLATVVVANPDNCKAGCPACARLCPNSAIMFPLCDEDDAIAGAPGRFVTPDDAAKAMFERRTHTPYREPGSADAALDVLIDELDQLAGGDRE